MTARPNPGRPEPHAYPGRPEPHPLSYEVNALRALLIRLPANRALDSGVLAGATTAAITVASLLLPRLPR